MAYKIIVEGAGNLVHILFKNPSENLSVILTEQEASELESELAYVISKIEHLKNKDKIV